MRHLLTPSLALLLFSATALGVPAYRELIQFRQADGSSINIRIQGDEHSHLILSEDGYLLLPQMDGNFSFATINDSGEIVPSKLPARNPDERNSATLRQLTKIDKERVKDMAVAKLTKASSLRLSSFKKHNSQEKTPNISHKAPGKIGLFPGSSYPTEGNPKALVILVEYADVKFNLPDPHAYFSGLLNEEGFSEYGATGCAAEWFADNSAGKFKPEFDVYGPVTLSAKRSYYGGNNNYGNDLAPQKMAVEACNVLDKDVDFSVYDTDGDGYIDNVFIFYAGTGENRTGDPDAVWPHTSWVTELEFPNHVYDGVILDRYACTNEWLEGVPDGIGTFCHEFSHVMGLPDLYHTALGSMAYTPGSWSVMDYGPYLNNSHTPPLYSSFERLALGWLTPEELTDDKSFALPELAANKAYSVTRDNGTEFFLFENRQNRGWDKYLPGHGMLVWRVDFNADVWDKRAVNNDENHQRVDLIEADNIKSTMTRDGDCFPGTSMKADFSPLTTPAFAYNDRTSPGLSISSIKERPGGEVTFRVGEGSEIPTDIARIETSEITATSAILKWQAVPRIERYLIEITDGKGAKVNESEISESIFTAENLLPLSEYSVKVWAYDGKEESANPATIKFSTPSPEIDYYRCEITGIAEITADGFTVEWLPVPKAEDYLLNVMRINRSEPYSLNIDFTDGIQDLPEGWVTTSRLTYASNAYSGESPLSLRLSTDSDNISSGKLDGPLYSISFWMRGSSAGEEDAVAVEVLNGDLWNEVASYPVSNASGGEVKNLDLSAYEGDKVRIIFHKKSEKGSVAIDDINFEWGGDRISESIPGWADRSVGNCISFKVDSLEADTEYMVSVKATDGELFSSPSDQVMVKTGKASSVTEIDNEGGYIRRYNLNGLPTKDTDRSRQITIEIKSDGTTQKYLPSSLNH